MIKVTWVAALAVGAAFALAGCGTDAPELPAGAGETPVNQADSDAEGQEGTGSVDCSKIDGAMIGEYSLYVQMLAQISEPASIETVVTLGYTSEKFEAALDNLEPVRAAAVTPLGDPSAALDYYHALNASMADLVAKGDAVTQADIDAYNAAAGSAEDILYNQIAINAPLSDACPDIEG